MLYIEYKLRAMLLVPSTHTHAHTHAGTHAYTPAEYDLIHRIMVHYAQSLTEFDEEANCWCCLSI